MPWGTWPIDSLIGTKLFRLKFPWSCFDFLTMHRGLTAEDAYALMSVAADFTVTQVVDQRRGVHAALAKRVFGDHYKVEAGGGMHRTRMAV
jgi:hypothetical protein